MSIWMFRSSERINRYGSYQMITKTLVVVSLPKEGTNGEKHREEIVWQEAGRKD